VIGVLKKYFKAAETARTEFQWNDSDHVFELTRMTLGLEPGSAFSTAALPPELLKAVPGDAQLVASVQVPKPASWSRESVKAILAPEGKLPKSGPRIPVTLVFLGMAKPEKGEVEGAKEKKLSSLTAALIPASEASDQALQDLDQLFSKKVFYDVRFKVVCSKWIALADNDEVLERIEKTCNGQEPSFEQMPPDMKTRLQGEKSAAWVYVNLGRTLSSMVELGSDLVAGEKSANEDVVRSTHGLLGRLPRVLLAGETQGDSLVLKGTLK
jgi:hypothetical protein